MEPPTPQEQFDRVTRRVALMDQVLASMADSVFLVDAGMQVTETLRGDIAAVRAGGAHFVEAARRALAGAPADFEWSAGEGSSRAMYSTTLAPLRDEAGAITGAVAATRDVTREHLQRAEQEEKRVRRQQAEKLEAIGEIAGGVADDFNSSLTIILSYTEKLLGALPYEDEDRLAIEEIRHAAERSAELTRQLRTFRHSREVEPTLLDLNAAVRDAAPLLQRLAGKGAALDVSLAGEVLPVLADRAQLGELLMSLVVNATEAMPDGGTVRIETWATEAGRDRDRAHVHLAVRDTGSGMSETTQAHMFEPFFTTKQGHDGAGLGLSAVYGIVQRWEGYVDVESTEGRGTTMSVALPRADATVEQLLALRARRETPAGGLPGPVVAEAPRSESAVTVLLVDDDHALRGVARWVLATAGYQVIEAASGLDALRLLDDTAQRIDVVISDMIMPGMGGRELAYEVRVRHPAAVLVLMSGYSREAVLRDDPLRHDTVFLDKPFKPDALLEATRQALASRASPAGTEAGEEESATRAPEFRRALDTLASGMDAIVWECDAASGRFHYVSRRAESLLGYDRQDWHREGFWASVVHPDDLARMTELRRGAAASLQGFSAEYRVRTAAGAEVWLCEYLSVVPASGGGAAQFRGVLFDVTGRKESEAALAASQARLAREHAFIGAVLENLSDGVAACDRAGRFTLFTASMQALVGRPRADIPAEERAAHYAIYHPDGLTPLSPAELPTARALRGEKLRDVELVVRPPDRSPRDVVASARPITDAGGTLLGAVLTVRDVTDAKRAAEELRRAKERAEHADRMKSEFLSLVSHELHTPLTAVIGFADVLRKNRLGRLTDGDLVYVDRIAANGRHLLSLVSNVLDVTRLLAGQLEMRTEQVSLDTAIEDTLAALEPEAKRKQLRLSAETPVALRTIAADPERLRQVLRIVIGNAIKYTDAGGVVVRVAAGAGDDTAERVEVADSGRGIAPEHLEAIFTPFFQEETFAGRREGGTGMSLVLARGLCEAMGFRITMQSVPGTGSLCTIQLRPPAMPGGR